jgi:transposase
MNRRKFTTEFKIAAAKLVTEQGYTQKQAADNLGVDPASIRAWIKLYAPARPATSAVPADVAGLQDENRRLREENRRLQLEREILKKATAFFAKEQS